ncbi:MAG: saccharopine dehydrogenase C-terminal domain-containing protein, partial [Bacteroidota bacterium]
AWNVFIELGMTDDSYKMDGSEKLTPRSFLNAFLPYHPNMSVEDKFRQFLGKEREGLFERFEWLGLFSKEVTIGVVNASPAQLLEKILTGKLVLNAGDKDMLVMYHEFEYEKDGQRYLVTSSMVNVGEDQIYTSMSNTVGLPVAIAAKMILNGQIRKHGVTLPIEKEIYTPILKELEDYGILFSETKTEF